MTYQWDEDAGTKTLRRENTEYIFGGKQTVPFSKVLGYKEGWKI